MQLLSKAVPIAMLAFVVSSMLAMGLSLTVRQIVEPLRNARLVSLALLANFVAMPLGAIGLARLLHLEPGPAAGLLVLGAAAGAPFLPKLASVAKANQAVAVGLMVLLMVLTIGYMPLVLPMLLAGVSVDVARIARSLVLLMLLPLGVGLAVKARYATAAAGREADPRSDRQHQPDPRDVADHHHESRATWSRCSAPGRSSQGSCFSPGASASATCSVGPTSIRGGSSGSGPRSATSRRPSSSAVRTSRIPRWS